MPRKTIICSKYTILNLALLSLYVIVGSLQITLTVSLNNYFIYFLFRNIDACITAAELEFCIEREQVEVMGISQVLLYSE